jgi:hypothetical protein
MLYPSKESAFQPNDTKPEPVFARHTANIPPGGTDTGGGVGSGKGYKHWYERKVLKINIFSSPKLEILFKPQYIKKLV